MDDDETLTAYHEAGHAVVGYVLGGTVDSIQLGGESDENLPLSFGQCRVNWGTVDPSCDWQRQREIMTFLAGPVAEMIYRCEPLHPAFFGPWQHDWQRAMATCLPITGDERRGTALLERMTVELHRRISENPYWPAISALSDELLAHEFLEQEQVAEVMRFWLRLR